MDLEQILALTDAQRHGEVLLKFFSYATREQSYEMMCSMLGMMLNEKPPRSVAQVMARVSLLTPHIFLSVCDTIERLWSTDREALEMAAIIRAMTNAVVATTAHQPHIPVA